jgi:hypothetical protein
VRMMATICEIRGPITMNPQANWTGHSKKHLPHRMVNLYDFSLESEKTDIIQLFEELLAICPFQPSHLSSAALSSARHQQKKYKDVRTAVKHLVDKAQDFKWIGVEKIQDEDFSEVLGRLLLDLQFQKFSVSAPTSDFSEELATKIIHLVARYASPSYGFVHVMDGGGAAASWGSGITLVDIGPKSDAEKAFDRLMSDRATALGTSLAWKKSHLTQLHDVYEVNILTSAHLALSLDETTLGSWIESHANGTLLKIGKGLFSWSVNDEDRPAVRDILYKHKCLFVDE